MNKLTIEQEAVADSIRDACAVIESFALTDVPIRLDAQTIISVASLCQKEQWGQETIYTRDAFVSALEEIKTELHNIDLDIPSR